LYGLFRREVAWRGTRLVVHCGTRIEVPARGEVYDGARADLACR
jgi:hypothetical protein